MILTDLEEKNSIKVSNSQNKWGLKSVVKNAFQATQAEIASNMPAPSSPSLLRLQFHEGKKNIFREIKNNNLFYIFFS